MKQLLFATGGSGGHIFPALAIAQEAKARGYNCIFMGQKTGIEAELVPKHGFDFIGVSAGKFNRSNPNPLAFLKVLAGFVEAIANLRQLKPDLVIGFGGFASFPGLAAATFLRIPYVLHEANAFPGLVTRWFAESAKLILVSQEAVYEHLPENAKKELVGQPINETSLSKLEARQKLGIAEDAFMTYVSGGSQGSLKLNTEVPKAFKKLQSLEKKHCVLHSTGTRWLEQVQTETKDLENYFTKGFLDATLAWSAADLAITRAGFGTLAEAAFHATPCIIIPLPSSAENHQYHNAQARALKGAGWVVEEAQLESLSEVWMSALSESKLKEASQAALGLSPKGASKRFVDAIERNCFITSQKESFA